MAKIILISLIYFIARMINLTKLPIFNDEAIYLDWGWRETHVPGYQIYSLYDGKQPFMMWVFGIFESILPDPLFAGRLVSVITGFLTLLGIYLIGKKFINTTTAVIASLLYIVIPIFSFFDRQALMESAIAAVGVWSCYFFLNVYKHQQKKDAISLGVILGVGFLIKSNAAIFIAAFVCVTLFIFFIYKKRTTLSMFFIALLSFFCTNILLFIQPAFLRTLSTNSRYALTPQELLRFPMKQWIENTIASIEIALFYLTPFVFLFFLLGIYLLIKSSKREALLVVLWFSVAIILFIFSTRNVSQRYIASFLPTTLLPCAYFFWKLLIRKNIFAYVIIAGSVALPVCITLLQITSPLYYFSFMDKLTSYAAKEEYVSTNLSGYGIQETLEYLENRARKKEIIIGIALNAGNPESAMIVYGQKKPLITTAYIDSKLFGEKVNKADCIVSQKPLYFISREEQLVGLDKFFQKAQTIKNPHGTNTIGIYTLKKPCEGNILLFQVQKT